MKIQQSTQNFAAPQKTRAAALPADQSVVSDSVELGSQARELESDIGRMYSLYRNSNSQYDQKNLKREMLARLDSSSGTLPARKQLEDLLTRLFDKNDKAWQLKSQQSKPGPETEVEFNSGKYDVAKGQPLCGDNLFNLGEWQRRKNLIPVLQPQDAKFKDVYIDIEDDLNRVGGKKAVFGGVADEVRRDIDLMGGRSRKELGSTADVIIRDLDLNQLQLKPGKSFRSDFASQLFDRLA